MVSVSGPTANDAPAKSTLDRATTAIRSMWSPSASLALRNRGGAQGAEAAAALLPLCAVRAIWQRPPRYARASAVVSVAASGGRDGGAHGYACTGQNPGALAGCEAWRQQPVVDLACHGEAVECRRREEQAGVVLEAVRRRVDGAFDGRDDAVAVLVHPGDLGRVGIEQPALQVGHGWLKRSRSLVDVHEDFVGQAAGNPPLPELPLGIDVAIELVGISGQVRIVAEHRSHVVDAARSRAGHDRL